MKGSQIFSSKSLKATDLAGQQPIVTIARVSTASFEDGTRKPVLHFEGKDKALILNKTNWNAVVEITGEEDSDDWHGHKVRLVVRRVEFRGDRVPAIRVEPPVRDTKVEPEPEPVTAADDDEIPF